MKYRLLPSLILSAALLLASCETMTNYIPPQAWNTTDNGTAVFMRGKSTIENRFVWDGSVDAEKKAHGFGKLTYSNPDIAGDPLFGGGFYPNTTTYEGKMVAGKFEGEVIRRDSVDASIRRWQFDDGIMTSAEIITPGRSSSGSSSGLSDGQLVGGMLGLSGIAGGDVGLASAGLTMLSGDESGGLSQMASWATSTPGGSGRGGSNLPGVSSAGGGALEGGNLIDEWGLRKTVKSRGDHMKYYIQAADQAFASYQKSGEKAYYNQHREYAGLARDFHQRTGTGTQGYAR